MELVPLSLIKFLPIISKVSCSKGLRLDLVGRESGLSPTGRSSDKRSICSMIVTLSTQHYPICQTVKIQYSFSGAL